MLESLSTKCIKGSSKMGLASNCHSGSINLLSDSLFFSSAPEKFPNKAVWICQSLMCIHTTSTLTGLFLWLGHHLRKLRKQLIPQTHTCCRALWSPSNTLTLVGWLNVPSGALPTSKKPPLTFISKSLHSNSFAELKITIGGGSCFMTNSYTVGIWDTEQAIF